MAKRPALGRVKTRLARQTSPVAAAAFYRNAVNTVVRRLAADPRWTTLLAVSPDDAVTDSCWPRGVPRIAQGTGSLGQRMQRLLEMPPPGPVLVIGTDIPAVTPAHIARAFSLLGNAEAVFGPAEDGGYWLVGLRRVPRLLQPFAGVRWSSPHALLDTRRNLLDVRVALADTLSDVDTAADLASWREHAARVVPPRAIL